MINTKKMYLVMWIFKFIPTSKANNLKSKLLRWAGAKVGKNVEIMSSAKIVGNMDLIIGDNCFIGHEALIFGTLGSTIEMEDYSKVGSRTIVVTGQHRYSADGDCVAKEGTFKNIKICKGALCDTASIILPGKTIGKMSHVVAGAVVTKDVSEYTRVGGIPAKVISNFKEEE